MDAPVDSNRRYVLTHFNRVTRMQTVIISPEIRDVTLAQENLYYGRKDSILEVIHVH